MKSVMMHDFSKVPDIEIPRSSFDRSHGLKTSFDSSGLYPIFVDEVVPGMSATLRTDFFVRMATLLHPIMDNMFLETFFFFVPNRLLWDNFQRQQGEQDNPGDSIDYLTPVIDDTTFTYQSLADYFGLPTDTANNLSGINALPFRAYNLIYNTWFRSQDLQDSLPFTKGDGPDDIADYNIVPRGKRFDYFTSCLPNPQKGPDVYMPLGTTAPILGIGRTSTYTFPTTSLTVRESGATASTTYANAFNLTSDLGGTESIAFEEDPNNPGYPGIFADLTNASAATVNQFREAILLQTLYEAYARSGTRYVEIVRSIFGVVSDDARLQRPEYLGGGSTRINVHPVASTTAANQLGGSAALGTLGAFGTAADSGHGFTKSFTEHGFIIGLANVRADLTYQQGVERMWSRRTRTDYLIPQLARLGEQAVLNKEIYADGSANDDLVFGYQERYAEYRYKPSRICSTFRSNAAGTLDSWHLAQDFASLPTLNADFIEDDVPFSRVMAVVSEQEFFGDFYFNYHCAMPLPLFSVPASLGRL